MVVFSCKTEPKTYTLKDFVEIKKINKVILTNYSGTFELNQSQLEKFKKELGEMIYLPNESYKLGAIGFELFLNKESYSVTSNSKSSYLEIPTVLFSKNKEIINFKNSSSYFDTKGINIQNYKP